MVGGKNPTYCGPNVQEKSVLLVKMMQCIEKRFPDLNCQFLDIIYNIYKYVFIVLQLVYVACDMLNGNMCVFDIAFPSIQLQDDFKILTECI